MGLFKTTLFFLTGFGVYGGFCVYKLGRKLPSAARKMGHKIGMSYNYLGILLKVMTPETTDQTGEILQVYKQTSQ